MKHILIITLALVLAACGVDSNRFAVKGRFLHLNQGEFYLYSEDADKAIDTIKIQGGRFDHEIDCTVPMTLRLVFPNFSEQAIFAAPGKTITIEGDASNMKEIDIEGTEDNELMTAFRKRTAKASPPETLTAIDQFVADHPASPAAMYLVRRYLIDAPIPDYGHAVRLLTVITERAEGQPGEAAAILKATIQRINAAAKGSKTPEFSAKTIDGKTVNTRTTTERPTLIAVWSPERYETIGNITQWDALARASQGRWQLITVSLSPSKKNTTETLERSGAKPTVVWDERLFESPIAQKLAIYRIPEYIWIKGGKIVARTNNAEAINRLLPQPPIQ